MLFKMQQQITRLTAAREKNLATFLGFSSAFFHVDIEHKTSFLKQKKIIPQVFFNVVNPEIMTSCFHNSAEVTSTDKG